MRILLVIPYFYPAEAFGGPVQVAFNVGRELVKRGHEVGVYTSDTNHRENRLNVKSAEVEGMKVYYFRNISMRFVKESNLFITPELSKNMKSEGFFKRLVLIRVFAVSSLFALPFAGKTDAIWAPSWVPAIIYGKLRRAPVALNVDDLTIEDVSALRLVEADSIF